MNTVGIVGLGLIGGSLARDLSAAGWRVLADDHDPGALEAARDAGVVDGPLGAGAADSADLLILALPVRAAPARLREIAASLAPDSRTVITDVGSTKRSVTAAALDAGLAPRFVGAHPMAGSHQCGWAASRTGLFHRCRVWTCPTSASTDRAVSLVDHLWRSVGARPEPITPDDHDRLMAHASHLPQLAATSLATTLAHHGVPPDSLGPGGRDATRLAASDPDMWIDILLDNADYVAPALSDLVDQLAALATAIRDADTDALRARLDAGRAWTILDTTRPMLQ